MFVTEVFFFSEKSATATSSHVHKRLRFSPMMRCDVSAQEKHHKADAVVRGGSNTVKLRQASRSTSKDNQAALRRNKN